MAKQFIDQFIKDLQPDEAKSISRYIKNNITNGEESKTLEVFEAMRAGRKISYINTVALNKIKSRIFEKSLDALMVDEQYIATTFSEIDKTAFKLRKQIIQCKMLQRKKTSSKTEAFQHLYNQIIAEAKASELFRILCDALDLKKYDMSKRQDGLESFEKITQEIIFYDYCDKAQSRAMDAYFRLILNNIFIQSYSEKELYTHIKNSINQMRIDFKKTKSQVINYYLHIMRFALYEKQKKYLSALAQCEKLMALMNKHAVIYRKDRVGFMLDNISLFHTLLGNYQEAFKTVQQAQLCLLSNSREYLTSKELEFHIHLYSNNYSLAKKCLTEILNHPLSDTGKYERSKFMYFKACMLFSQKQYKEALALLIKPMEIEKDKERWNISIRILIILIHIELNKPEEASRAVEALRKYINRNKINDKIRPRDLLIIKTLREMEKTDFEGFEKNSFIKKALRQLGTKNKTLSWEYYSAEMIPFHEWLESKL